MGPLLPWLILKSIPGLNNKAYLSLVEAFGSPQAVLKAAPAALERVNGISRQLATSIASYRPPAWIREELATVQRENYKIFTIQDGDYPCLLRHIADPPPVLYVKGTIHCHEPSVAIVGSRMATRYGLQVAESLARDLAQQGWTVVSGLAHGIDAAAHKGALKAGGRTIAILGTGINVIYPKNNKEIYDKIPQSGALVSEFFLDTEPKAHHFPVRNRIISGICYATVVVEAARRSGALITARLALEQGREVFAVPGNINSAASKGTHLLIRQGAILVENADQIISELAAQVEPGSLRAEADPAGSHKSMPVKLESEEKKVYELIDVYPIHIDEIANQCSLDPGRLAAVLMQLELKGIIARSPGKYFQRV